MTDIAQPDASLAGTVDLGGDLTVNRMGFGAMRITGEGIWGDPPDRETAKAVLRRAVELGVDFIDTADAYGPGVSEELIAEALAPYPDDLVVATKGGLVRQGPGQWNPDGRPEHLREACEASLRRLRLEQIPLYQFHRPDPRVPIEESIGALAQLKDEGKIRHVGLSNVDEEQLRRAGAVTAVVSIQNRCNLVDRSSESLLDLCEQEELTFLPWAPVIDAAKHPALGKVAAAHGASASQVALAWLLARSPVMLVIPGTGSVQHLEQNVAAAAIELDPAEVAELSAAASFGVSLAGVPGGSDLVTRSGLRLPAGALAWRFSRASGPGGQHVNTSDTRVELVAELVALDGPPAAVERARAVLGQELRVVAASERSQLQNRAEAWRRLAERLDAAARPRRRRRRTVPPRSAVESRLRAKRATAERKASRRAASRNED